MCFEVGKPEKGVGVHFPAQINWNGVWQYCTLVWTCSVESLVLSSIQKNCLALKKKPITGLICTAHLAHYQVNDRSPDTWPHFGTFKPFSVLVKPFGISSYIDSSCKKSKDDFSSMEHVKQTDLFLKRQTHGCRHFDFGDNNLVCDCSKFQTPIL